MSAEPAALASPAPDVRAEERLAWARNALNAQDFAADPLNEIVLHTLIALGELLARLDARQAAQVAQSGAPE
ncbi:hypothetical protein I5H08_gp002 [Mycobacterium phage Yuna]|uniref:Uncharacterized protein n=1 Tax=Mycobacterium phage Yuna TaxID=2599885 RepID=A0A5J6TFG9_9CAUD|nr:hypothetical protein I5H08_gp002 [Mycobacterium phage Yuna]QFG09385.1 hypothetical protein PBI_YUNA_2 [Mycobacterium phage Yuna]